MLAKLPDPLPGIRCHEKRGWLPTGFDVQCREIINKQVRAVLRKSMNIPEDRTYLTDKKKSNNNNKCINYIACVEKVNYTFLFITDPTSLPRKQRHGTNARLKVNKTNKRAKKKKVNRLNIASTSETITKETLDEDHVVA